MAKAIHVIRYRYVCEHCGQQTDWFDKRVEAETNVLGTVIEEGLPGSLGRRAGGAIASDELRAALRGYKDRVAEGNYTFFDAGASCPNCGRRQSWLPVHDVTSISPGGRVALYGLGLFAVGLVIFAIALVLTMESSSKLAQTLGMVIGGGSLIFFPILGIAKAVKRNRRDALGNRVQQQAVTVKNAPEIDWRE